MANTIGTKIPIEALRTECAGAKKDGHTALVIVNNGREDAIVRVPHGEHAMTFGGRQTIQKGDDFRIIPLDGYESCLRNWHPQAKACVED